MKYAPTSLLKQENPLNFELSETLYPSMSEKGNIPIFYTKTPLLNQVYIQPLGKEPFRRWEPFGIHNSSGFPNRIPAISLKNVQVGAVPSSTVYLQPL